MKENKKYNKLLNKQQLFFKTGKTLNLNFRLKALVTLKKSIKKNENLILNALKQDLNKNKYESLMSELSLVYSELNNHIKNLRKWSADEKVSTPITLKPSSSYIKYEPYGNALIISPWNYPFQLAITPLIGAISAGNTAIIKPSEITTNTSKIIKKIISETFDEKFVCIVEGSVEASKALLKQKFDIIFFTGGERVGKIIMESAAKNLTPVILELGGKSPVIVDNTVNLKNAAKKIAFGKILNAGQICVAPDYALVHEDIYDDFIKQYKKVVNKTFPIYKRKKLASMTSIVNENHFERVKSLIASSNVIFGGKTDEKKRKVFPALTYEGDIRRYVHYKDDLPPIMKEEIFAPILPILTYKNIEDCIEFINDGEKPLALYIFTKDKLISKKVLSNTHFGNGCINDTVVHLSNENLPFGGVGSSGMGSYHGKYSFYAFSHKKSILKSKDYFDIPLKYRPYYKIKYGILKQLYK